MGRIILIVAMIGIALSIAPRAGAAPGTVHYAAGWNMVGAPAGTDYTPAQDLKGYGSGSYSSPSTRMASACRGYWAYFTAPTDVPMASSPSGTRTCALQPGWNMVGNPFSTVAIFSPDPNIYYWDTSSGSYVTATHIPVGGAIWVYATDAGSLTLQSAPQGEVTITAPPPPQEPVSLQVGQYLTLVVPASDAGPIWEAHSDPAYLQPVGSGRMPRSTSFYYRWQATTAGMTIITLDPACLKIGCRAPSYGVRVTILP